MFSRVHLTNSVGLTSPITEILLHYCFISILFLIIEQASVY